MRFEQSLWDGSDPAYAPCIRKSKGYFYWVAPRRYVKAGYAVKRAALQGRDGDGADLDRAAQCRDLTRDMLRWWDGLSEAQAAPGTWKWLIARYKTDEFSPYHGVKANTRKGYDQQLALIERAIGSVSIAKATYPWLMQIKVTMQKKGRSVAYIHRWFNTLRRVAHYGVMIEDSESERVSLILSKMRIQSPAARSVAPTAADIAAIVRESDAAGTTAFSIGILIQWWWMLRAVDVRGQHLDGKWADGLTWEMFTPDLKFMTKTISKTARSLPEPYTFDLTKTPDIRQRLTAWRATLPERCLTGPVILHRQTLQPYTIEAWGRTWARYRDRAGLDKRLLMMDTRSGAITEASNSGAKGFALRNAAGHKDIETTGRYARGRSEDAGRVVSLRQRKAK